MATESEVQIKKELPKKDEWRVNVTIKGKPAEMVHELKELGLYNSNPALIIEGIKLVYEKDLALLRMKQKTTDQD